MTTTPQTAARARNLFHEAFGAEPNFMTPNLIWRDITRSGKWAYELSYGSGIEPGTTIFGVTVVPPDGSKRGDESYDVSRLFHSREDAEAYVTTL